MLVDCSRYILDTFCIIDFWFRPNKMLNLASVSFSAETTLLKFGPISVVAKFVKKISSDRSLILGPYIRKMGMDLLG